MPPGAAGERLDRFLAGVEEVGSRAAAERLLGERRVLVDGAVRPKSYRLEGGEQVHDLVREVVVGAARLHGANVCLEDEGPEGPARQNTGELPERVVARDSVQRAEDLDGIGVREPVFHGPEGSL